MHEAEELELLLAFQIAMLVQRQIRIAVPAQGQPGMHQGQQQTVEITVRQPVEMGLRLGITPVPCGAQDEYQAGHRLSGRERRDLSGKAARALQASGKDVGSQRPDHQGGVAGRLRRDRDEIFRCALRILLPGRVQRRQVGAPCRHTVRHEFRRRRLAGA